jgi:hypothetical protein
VYSTVAVQVRGAVALTIFVSLGAVRPAAAQQPSTRPPDARSLGTGSSTRQADVRSAGAGHQLLGTFIDSLKLLTIEHGLRIGLQQKTREALRGNFWRDYQRSLRVPRQWEDGDPWLVNYIGHPLHGASAGYIWLEHAGERHPDISLSRSYWASRAQAAAWAAVYSVQFEFGPLSEASIGNVGLREETTGWVDHVTTPAGAFALMVGEDALDRFFVRWVESHTPNRFFRAALRMTFNPSRTFSNATTGHLPWYREGRSLDWKPNSSSRP